MISQCRSSTLNFAFGFFDGSLEGTPAVPEFSAPDVPSVPSARVAGIFGTICEEDGSFRNLLELATDSESVPVRAREHCPYGIERVGYCNLCRNVCAASRASYSTLYPVITATRQIQFPSYGLSPTRRVAWACVVLSPPCSTRAQKIVLYKLLTCALG